MEGRRGGAVRPPRRRGYQTSSTVVEQTTEFVRVQIRGGDSPDTAGASMVMRSY